MERYHIYKLGLAILFYAVFYARQMVVNGLKIDDVTSTTNTTDYRERRDSGDDNTFFFQGADGTPGVDFPTLSYVPRTKFSCRGMEAGYYADLETDCQAFHICDEGRKLSFLCPNGTVFQQSELICDWWFKVNCSNSPSLYEESAEILQKENAKRKESRRLSYHGTKQGVFSSREDDYEQGIVRGTPAHLVTASYPYKSSLNTFNKISISTESSVRRNYNGRGDRKLDSFGNGVRERDYDRSNQFSTGRGQNGFGVNVLDKAENLGNIITDTNLQGITSGQGSTFDYNFQGKPRGQDQTAFSTSTQQKASTVGQFSFDKSLQQTSTRNQGAFGSSLQGNSNGFRQGGFDLNLQGRSESRGKASFGGQQSTGERDHNIFGTNLQGKPVGSGQSSFGVNLQQKFETSSQLPFGAKTSISAGHISFDRSSQQGISGSGQSIFGTSSQGQTGHYGQNNFGASLEGKSETAGRVTFGVGGTQEKSSSIVSKTPFAGNFQQVTTGRDQNIFNAGLQGNKAGVGQNTFGVNLQGNLGGSGVGGEDNFGRNLEDKNKQQKSEAAETAFGITRRDQETFTLSSQAKPSHDHFNIFGTSTRGGFGQTTPSIRLHGGTGSAISSQTDSGFGLTSRGKPTGRLNVFVTSSRSGFDQTTPGIGLESGLGINTQQSGEVEQSTHGTTSQKESGQDKVSVTTRGKPFSGHFNIFGTSTVGYQHTTPSSRFSNGLDKVKFSITSEDKSNEFATSKQQQPGGYQQNVVGAGDNDEPNTTGRNSQSTFGVSGQGSFDISLQGKPGKLDETTSRFGFKSTGPTQTPFSVTSQRQQYTAGEGKIFVNVISGETQEPQETASFVKNSLNNLQGSSKQGTTISYPNHRATYSEIKDPRYYYEKPQSKLPEKPFYGSSISPQVLSTIPVSIHEDGLTSTTEISPSAKSIGFNFGSKTDISTTKQPSGDLDSSTGRVYNINTLSSATNKFGLNIGESSSTASSRGGNYFDSKLTSSSSATDAKGSTVIQGVNIFGVNNFQTTDKPATIDYNKVHVNNYDKSYTTGLDVSLNSVSSTLSPDSLDDANRKSTTFSGYQGAKYYDGLVSTPAVGINNYGQSNIQYTGKTSTDSPVIKLNVIPSTALPGFEPTDRTGKAFNIDSPKTQILTDQGFKDYSKSPFGTSGSERGGSTLSVSFGSGDQEFTSTPIIHEFTSSSQTVSPGFLGGKDGGPTSLTNSFGATASSGLTSSVSVNRLGNTDDTVDIATSTSRGLGALTLTTGYENNLVTPTSKTVENIQLQVKPTTETNRVEFSINKESHNVPSQVGGGAVDVNINNRSYTYSSLSTGNTGRTPTLPGRIGVDVNIPTSSTPVKTETIEFTITDKLFTTPASISTDVVQTNINDQKYSTPTPVFSVTRPNGFDITATTEVPSKDESTQNILFTSSSSILQPKPFSVSTDTVKTGVTEGDTEFKQTKAIQIPSYKISSASPFATTSKQSGDLESKTPAPTLPTLFTSTSPISYPYEPTDENVNNMINTLMEVVKQRFGSSSFGDNGFGTPRPGLVVPPSAGPHTLHTLAIYFANALDNLTSSSPREQSPHVQSQDGDEELETDSPIIHIDNEELIKSLLTQMTLNNYEDLFKEKDATTTEYSSVRSGTDDSENDLFREDTKHPTEGPGVRQLARVFTEALSAYLEDPDTFKKVLHDVRPTEPPPLSFGNDTTEAEEDEVLNYSDSDLKSDHPHLSTRPTGITVSPTLGYILAFNKTLTTNDNVETRNSLSSDTENLQSADSQSLISQLNKVSQELKTTLSLSETAKTTEATYSDFTNEEDRAKTLPENHWTTSSDIAKLLQTTLLLNPATLNDNFDSTANEQGFTTSDVDNIHTRFYGVTSPEDTSSESSSRSTVVSEIQYELRSLPKIELNSTQVHGILIDFMNATKTDGSAKLQRILHKLNISQDEFLDKMKEIEGNPLTRRLILLLISECNTDKNKVLETRAAAGDSIFSLAQYKLNSESTESPSTTSSHLDTDLETVIGVTTDSNSLKHIVHPSLDDDDEDTRALELLNSLYVIASKFGK